MSIRDIVESIVRARGKPREPAQIGGRNLVPPPVAGDVYPHYQIHNEQAMTIKHLMNPENAKQLRFPYAYKNDGTPITKYAVFLFVNHEPQFDYIEYDINTTDNTVSEGKVIGNGIIGTFSLTSLNADGKFKVCVIPVKETKYDDRLKNLMKSVDDTDFEFDENKIKFDYADLMI